MTEAPSPGALLAIDLGTTRIKFGTLASDGSFRVLHSVAAPTAFPCPGAAVQDTAQVLARCMEGLRLCADAVPVPEALVLTGQMGGLVIVDEHAKPCTPWVTAMDTRCSYERALLPRLRIRALSAATPFQAERILWVQGLQTLPRRAIALLLPAFIATQLAREAIAAAFCERTSLGWTGLADVVRARWDDILVGAARWSPDQLPPIVEPGTIVGHLSPDAARQTRLPEGVALIAGPGDQAATLYGLGCTRPGQMVDSASTFPILCGVSERFGKLGGERIEVMPSAVSGLWHPLGYLPGSGALLPWFAGMFADATADELEREAEQAGPSDGLVVLPAGVPGVVGDSRAVFWGVDVAHRRGHFYRALLEGLACEYALMAEDLRAAGITGDGPVVAVGGGTESALLTRLKAQLTGRPWKVLGNTTEMALYGAALFAARGLGWRPELALPQGETVEPDPAEADRYDRLRDCYRRLRCALGAVGHGSSEPPAPT